MKAKPRMQQPMRVGVGSKARAGGPIKGASWRSEGKRSRKTDLERKLDVSRKAGWRLAGGASRRLIEKRSLRVIGDASRRSARRLCRTAEEGASWNSIGRQLENLDR